MIEVGQTWRVPFPYHKVDDGGVDLDFLKTWYIGCREETDENCRYFEADGFGYRILDIVAIVPLPGKMLPRVLFRQSWQYPDERIAKSDVVLCVTERSFLRKLEGFRFDVEYTGDATGEEQFHDALINPKAELVEASK